MVNDNDLLCNIVTGLLGEDRPAIAAWLQVKLAGDARYAACAAFWAEATEDEQHTISVLLGWEYGDTCTAALPAPLCKDFTYAMEQCAALLG